MVAIGMCNQFELNKRYVYYVYASVCYKKRNGFYADNAATCATCYMKI